MTHGPKVTASGCHAAGTTPSASHGPPADPHTERAGPATRLAAQARRAAEGEVEHPASIVTRCRGRPNRRRRACPGPNHRPDLAGSISCGGGHHPAARAAPAAARRPAATSLGVVDDRDVTGRSPGGRTDGRVGTRLALYAWMVWARRPRPRPADLGRAASSRRPQRRLMRACRGTEGTRSHCSRSSTGDTVNPPTGMVCVAEHGQRGARLEGEAAGRTQRGSRRTGRPAPLAEQPRMRPRSRPAAEERGAICPLGRPGGRAAVGHRDGS